MLHETSDLFPSTLSKTINDLERKKKPISMGNIENEEKKNPFYDRRFFKHKFKISKFNGAVHTMTLHFSGEMVEFIRVWQGWQCGCRKIA